MVNFIEYVKNLTSDFNIRDTDILKIQVAEGDLDSALASKINGKVDDSALATVAKTGNVKDLTQTPGEFLILNCGSATEVI